MPLCSHYIWLLIKLEVITAFKKIDAELGCIVSVIACDDPYLATIIRIVY